MTTCRYDRCWLKPDQFSPRRIEFRTFSGRGDQGPGCRDARCCNIDEEGLDLNRWRAVTELGGSPCRLQSARQWQALRRPRGFGQKLLRGFAKC